MGSQIVKGHINAGLKKKPRTKIRAGYCEVLAYKWMCIRGWIFWTWREFAKVCESRMSCLPASNDDDSWDVWKPRRVTQSVSSSPEYVRGWGRARRDGGRDSKVNHCFTSRSDSNLSLYCICLNGSNHFLRFQIIGGPLFCCRESLSALGLACLSWVRRRNQTPGNSLPLILRGTMRYIWNPSSP